MATTLRIANVLAAAWLIATPRTFFGQDASPGTRPLFSVPYNEACVPDAEPIRQGNRGSATVSVASLLVPESATRAYERAEKLLAQGRPDDADKVLGKAATVYTNSPVSWCLTGTVHEERLQFEAASADYSRALSADPKMLPAYLGLARIAYRDHKWEDVRDLTRKVMQMARGAFPVAYLYNAVALLQMSDLSNAEKSAREFLSFDSRHERPQAYLLLADILTAEGDYASAAEQEKIFLSIVPDPSNVPNSSDAEFIRQQIKSLEARSK